MDIEFNDYSVQQWDTQMNRRGRECIVKAKQKDIGQDGKRQVFGRVSSSMIYAGVGQESMADDWVTL